MFGWDLKSRPMSSAAVARAYEERYGTRFPLRSDTDAPPSLTLADLHSVFASCEDAVEAAARLNAAEATVAAPETPEASEIKEALPESDGESDSDQDKDEDDEDEA